MYRKKVLNMLVRYHLNLIWELILVPIKILLYILVPIICFIVALISTRSIKKSMEILDNYMWKTAYKTMTANLDALSLWYKGIF